MNKLAKHNTQYLQLTLNQWEQETTSILALSGLDRLRIRSWKNNYNEPTLAGRNDLVFFFYNNKRSV